MNIKTGRSSLQGQIKIISSKSDAHRLLIGAALGDRPLTLVLEGWSADIEATKNCLEGLGSIITRDDETLRITPIPLEVKEEALLDCGESGSTLRFLLPLITALGRHAIVEGHGRLPERPIDVIVEQLRAHGCQVEGDCLPLEMKGTITGGEYTLPGNISSQFITGLLFALPLLKEDSKIVLTTEIESRGYVDMTRETLSLFGIVIEQTTNGYFIKGGQKYHSPEKVIVEGDWSGAAFWLAAGAMNGDIYCTGLRKDSKQGDMEIVSLLKSFGGDIIWEKEGVRARKGALRGITIDAAQIPDLVPILCAVGAVARGQTEIYNAGRLRIKESDRLEAMAEGLRRLGVGVVEKPEGIVIHGGCEPPEGEVILDGYGDHRIVMALSMAAAALGVEVVMEGAEAVAKSYPTFFAELIRLGGVADVF